jgi:hypothetical protein
MFFPAKPLQVDTAGLPPVQSSAASAACERDPEATPDEANNTAYTVVEKETSGEERCVLLPICASCSARPLGMGETARDERARISPRLRRP